VVVTGSRETSTPVPVITVFEFNKMRDGILLENQRRDDEQALAAARDTCRAKVASTLKVCQRNTNASCAVASAVGATSSAIACEAKLKAVPPAQYVCMIGSAGAWALAGVGCAEVGGNVCSDWATQDLRACNLAPRESALSPVPRRNAPSSGPNIQ
jgi:hypothetical protein